MQITSRFVGTGLKDLVLEVGWRQSMNYAAAVGDDNPRYFDDERPAGIVAPPMLAVALTWPAIARIWEFIEAEDFPLEILPTMVHYSEHLQFHRLLRPEEKVTIRGRIAAIAPHRSGTLVAIRFEARDAAEAPVFTEHIGALMRGVACADPGAGLDSLPEVPRLEAEPAAPLWEAKRNVDRLRPFLYDGCTEIVFPIHTSQKFARQVGLPGIILQGTATLAMAVRELTDREAEGDPGRLKSIACRFGGMVPPGSEVRVRLLAAARGAEATELHFVVLNHENKPAIGHGVAQLERKRS
jgi:acyl dehydratase